MQLAQSFGAVIVNADSIQMYQHVNVGSAKPSQTDRERVPHFLFDFVAPPQVMTAGEYHRLFFSTLDEMARTKQSLVFVVGGTGFYFQALEKGIPEIPPANHEYQAELMKTLKEPDGEAKLFAELAKQDPETARKIHPHDHYRVLRALDVMHATGRPVSEVWAEHRQNSSKFPYELLKIGIQIERQELKHRLEARTEEMLSDGWIDEVKGLLQQGLQDWEPLSSVGYKQIVDFLTPRELSQQLSQMHSQKLPEKPSQKLSGKPTGSSLAPTMVELPIKIVQASLQLAKKQRTWFQRDKEVEWYRLQNSEAITARVRSFIDSEAASR